ncbi:MAG: MarR family transcriptional regulator [Alphaproteobacteria bacterium]|nr:MAG: MarR family transcriptional regulator [Alphaproteobacteria bacterium]
MKRKAHDITIIELSQSIGRLYRRMRSAAASQELSLTEGAVLVRLDKHGPATTADLARAEAVKPQSMGATIAALEERGLVARKAHATDGRQFNIALTPKGKDVRESVRHARRTWLAESIAKLDEEEQQLLFKASKILLRLAES